MQVPDKKTIRVIRSIALNEFKLHPEAQYQDFYKLFFQSYFGPGHAITNHTIAFEYLQREITTSTQFDSVLLQNIGNEMYRVNLILVKNNTISAERLFSSFINSQKTEPDFDKWIKLWSFIQSLLKSLSEINFKIDSVKFKQFSFNPKSLVSHSEIFKKKYHPHYRIVKKKNIPKKLNYLL